MVAMMLAIHRASSEPSTTASTGKIDLHSHYVPEFWREESIKAGYGEPDGIPGIPVSSSFFSRYKSSPALRSP
jgi:hypothetical protein